MLIRRSNLWERYYNETLEATNLAMRCEAQATGGEQEEHGFDNGGEQKVIPIVRLGDSWNSSVSNFECTTRYLEVERVDEADWMEQVEQIKEHLGHFAHD
ncbi:hypothetical protein Syun_020617 [Stephania yunnanensis]|uniref:Uncharacterized protein n=1 Tax=Stephania yunnanensis TaxID=152371 RepID=A0AAP0IET6_9MAGN